jgi:hypothetical protein
MLWVGFGSAISRTHQAVAFITCRTQLLRLPNQGPGTYQCGILELRRPTMAGFRPPVA